MRISMGSVRLLACAAGLLAASGAQAAEKSLMHCFTFTPIKSATQADWDAFYKATDAMPGKMPGIVKHAWAGKLSNAQTLYNVDAETRKKFTGDVTTAEGKASKVVREYGACLEMAAGSDTLKKYEAHPYHAEWMKAYEKVRVAGTTTFNFVSE